MKLELGYIQINDIQFSKECKVENSTLFVDPDAVKAFMYEDDDVKAWVKDFSFDVAKPGESVRQAVVQFDCEQPHRSQARHSVHIPCKDWRHP